MQRLNRVTLRVLVLLLVTAALAIPVVFAPAAVARGPEDDEEIRVVSLEVASDFPNNITFRLSAEGPDPIEEIRVFLKPAGSDQSTYGYLDIEPGTLVNGEYAMLTGGSNHKPPGTAIRYSFEIRDTAGRVLRTDDKEFLYMDDQLEWKEITEGILTVYYYGDFVERRARTVLETAQKTMEDMGRVLGIRPEKHINIVGYSNYRDMSRGLPFRSQAVREELQTQGQAYVEERVLMMLLSETNVTGVASHEFTHILVAEAAAQGYSRVPAWLNEGLAEYGNVDQTPYYDYALNYAVYTRRLKPLWYQDTFVGDPDDIVMAYGQGRSVVRYLIGAYGEDKMTELMKAFQTSLSADEALKRVYGFDTYGLDSEWRLVIGLEPLSPPGEPESQLTATPGAPEAAEPDVTSAPTPEAEATPAPDRDADREPAAASDDGGGTPRSCSGPASGSASFPLDLAMLGLLGGPLFGLTVRWGLARTALTSRLRRAPRGPDVWPDSVGR